MMQNGMIRLKFCLFWASKSLLRISVVLEFCPFAKWLEGFSTVVADLRSGPGVVFDRALYKPPKRLSASTIACQTVHLGSESRSSFYILSSPFHSPRSGATRISYSMDPHVPLVVRVRCFPFWNCWSFLLNFVASKVRLSTSLSTWLHSLDLTWLLTWATSSLARCWGNPLATLVSSRHCGVTRGPESCCSSAVWTAVCWVALVPTRHFTLDWWIVKFWLLLQISPHGHHLLVALVCYPWVHPDGVSILLSPTLQGVCVHQVLCSSLVASPDRRGRQLWSDCHLSGLLLLLR